jgi:UDP-N-acetylmuramate--alanine ligase
MDYHIVGIAGAGMSGIAHLLLDQGFSVSGSDRQANGFTVRLQQRGVSLAIGHDASFGANAKVVIATSAVPDDHVELVAARAAGTPVLRRADVWHRWSQERSIIAVAGTHGKSTTTAMLALLLLRAGYDVGFLLGAEFPLLGTSARWGDSDAPLVIEADEYDGAFFGLLPDFAVVTSVEWDHPDCYPTEAAYREAFAQFASQARDALVVSDQVPQDWRDELARDATVGDAGSQQRQSVMTYGLRDETDYAATPGRGNVSADRNVACWQHWWVSLPVR